MKETNKVELERLQSEYTSELSKKQDLDARLNQVRNDLTEIEQTFPKKLKDI